MAPLSKSLRVTITNGRGNTARAPGLAAWLQRIAPSRARGDVAIALVSDARIRSLNRRFRRIDKPTDVLAFAAAEPGAVEPVASAFRRKHNGREPVASAFRRKHNGREPVASAFRRKQNGLPFTQELGDIVISLNTARRQARAAGHSLSVELKVLALHGLLHLLGYDHHQQTDRVRMRRVEARLRVAGGLRAGLIERAGS